MREGEFDDQSSNSPGDRLIDTDGLMARAKVDRYRGPPNCRYVAAPKFGGSAPDSFDLGGPRHNK
jgi:hypothetical protein